MSINYVQTGTNPNDGTGDDLRTAMQKINANLQYLDQKGGENNLAFNLPIGSGQGYGLFYQKGILVDANGIVLQNNATALNFRSIKAGTGIALTIDTDYNIVIANTSSQQTTITTINGNVGTYTAPSANSSILIKGDTSPGNPTPYTTVTVTGNNISIAHDSRLVKDSAPTLGANLTLNSYSIVGTGSISNVGSITTDSVTIGRPTQSAPNPGVLSVIGSVTATSGTISTLSSTNITASNNITATNTITASAGFIGNLTGNVSGILTGNIKDSYGHVIFNNVTDTFTGTNTNPLTFSGIHTGAFSGNLNGALSLTDSSNNNYNITGSGQIVLTGASGNIQVTNSDTYNVSSFTQTGLAPPYGDTLSLKLIHKNLTVTQTGPSLGFTSIDLSGVGGTNLGTVDHGLITMLADQTNVSAFYIRTRSSLAFTPYTGRLSAGNGVTPAYSNVFRVDGNASTQFSGVIFSVNSTTPYTSTLDIDQTPYLGGNNFAGRDINITNSSSGYVSFYGLYKMPKSLGTAGQVLSVPLSGNILVWSNNSGGGGGGGASYLSALLDGPGPYQNTDANKVLTVNSAHTGFVYSNVLTGLTLNNSQLYGNASSATALQTPRTINGVSFDGSANISFTSDSVSEGTTNLYFTQARSRSSISVTANQALSYSSSTGNFNLNASVTPTALYLVQRDSNGFSSNLGIKTDSIGIYSQSSITVNNDLTGTFNITTGATVSANNFVTTGVGIPEIDSQSKIVLNPTTYVDLSSKNISNLANPVSAQDAATKTYVDTSVSAVSTAAITTIPINANSGGSFNLAKGSTLTFTGSNNITTTTGTNSVTIALASTISGVNFSSGFTVSGQVSATTTKGGNITVGGVDGNTITQTQAGSDLKLTPGSGATPGAVVATGYMEVDTSLCITSAETLTIPPTSTAVTASVDSNVTFVVTQDDVNDPQASLAYITLPSSNRNGQIKTFKMKSRGQYGTNALNNSPRYAIISGNIDGSSKQIFLGKDVTVGSSSPPTTISNPFHAITMISLNGYWWIMGEYITDR